MPPVLLIVFNRPDTTRRVMQRLREVQPERLYVFADGPRPHKGEAERALSEEARRIATEVDWPCELRTRFLDHNVGCGLGVPSGINFMFEHEEEGIILEDDILPDPSFFPFCADLLERYRDDDRVATIGGFNFLPHKEKTTDRVLVSNFSGIWGWATWKRVWEKTDWQSAMAGPATDAMLSERFGRVHADVLRSEFSATSARTNEAWDYCWYHGWLTRGEQGLIPAIGLVENIGFGSGTHHGGGAPAHIRRLSVGKVTFPLRLPETLVPDRDYDRAVERAIGSTPLRRAIGRIRGVITPPIKAVLARLGLRS